ncbi:MAG: hypothetical protein AABY53_09105 [Bdellovibrionota bacterium]
MVFIKNADKSNMSDAALKLQSKSNDIDITDLGRPDTMRYNILTMVINEEYDRAIATIKEFIETDSDYPNFRVRIEKYSLHSVDLIHAIRTKRNFPGLSGLTRTKQQELRDKFKEHFNELRFVMRKIEECMEQLRINDVRSTNMVIKSFWFSLVVVFVTGFFLEIIRGLGYTAEVVFNGYLDKVMSFFFSKFL